MAELPCEKRPPEAGLACHSELGQKFELNLL